MKRYLESQTKRDKMLNPSKPHFDFDIDSLHRDYRNSDYQYEILITEIKAFESELNDDEEVCVRLASFGQSILMSVVEIGYSEPSILLFYGYVDGQYSQLIQHINQLSFLLMARPKSDPDKPARRIGFAVYEEVD
ncbi:MULTISPECIES: DUF6173 family protein [unclassified Paenibacillus]|uniref:DUF6173 family protein n=1 Tax=unclassified Paenibacillus TaxID=185978 RepID=UPI00247418C2|nr:DUF6173 family protein [Paenibacillus sp. PastF-3]